MLTLRSYFPMLCRRLPAFAYLATVTVFLWLISGFYLPGQGFTAMLLIGEKNAEHALPQLLEQKPYIEKDSEGYDGQFYVQIAMQPDLHDPALNNAIDSLPYRARRIFLGWFAWLLGGGDAGRTMHVFSMLNVVCWLGLAWLLLRWFPADSWGNFIRWFGVMFSIGLCFSVRGSLLDGPSLLVIAISLALWESGWLWTAALALAVAGLIRETNILAVVAFIPIERRSRAEFGRAAMLGALAVLPCVLWFLYLSSIFGFQSAGGSGNFAFPLSGFFLKWQTALADLARGVPDARTLLFLVSLTTQAVFFLLLRRGSNPWWRLGVAFLVLMVVLGDAVWEGNPGAASRTLLPMGLAFNVLVPRGRRWLPILLLGNATVLCTFQSFQYPGGESFAVTGPAALHQGAGAHRDWTVRFSKDWFPPKRSVWEYWRWGRERAEITISNPLAQPVLANVHFDLRSREARTVTIRCDGEILWNGTATQKLQAVQLDRISLRSGAVQWEFSCDQPATTSSVNNRRADAFCLRNLKIELLRVEPTGTLLSNQKIPAP